MKRLMLICSIFALAITVVIIKSENAIAGGSSACPVFTPGMVDAAAMAFGLHQGVEVDEVEDDPNFPFIVCTLSESGAPNKLELDVNYYEPGSAFAHGRHEREGDDLNADLYSYGEELSVPQMRACRAVILRSFVWKKYCAPALP